MKIFDFIDLSFISSNVGPFCNKSPMGNLRCQVQVLWVVPRVISIGDVGHHERATKQKPGRGI